MMPMTCCSLPPTTEMRWLCPEPDQARFRAGRHEQFHLVADHHLPLRFDNYTAISTDEYDLGAVAVKVDTGSRPSLSSRYWKGSPRSPPAPRR